MAAKEAEQSMRELLESWKSQLQASYIRLTVKIARYEQGHMLGSEHQLYGQLDRLERVIARADQALKLLEVVDHKELMPQLNLRDASGHEEGFALSRSALS